MTSKRRQFRPRPEYRPDFHFPKGTSVNLEQIAFNENGYIDLEHPVICPRCGNKPTRCISANDRAVTAMHRRMSAEIMVCDVCDHGFIVLTNHD